MTESTIPPDACRAFVEQVLLDAHEHSVKPLHRYLEEFPGDIAGIAAEYLALVKHGIIPDLPMPLSAPSGLRAEERIGSYRLIRRVGSGGQGAVYLAEDLRLPRKVALKVLHDRPVTSADALTRFRREADIASSLDHPGICTVYEADVESGVPFIAMRWVEGQTLLRHLAQKHLKATSTVGPRNGRPSESSTESSTPADDESESSTPSTAEEVLSILAIIEQSARALHTAHEAGVVHRDIKPGNIMVTADDRPVILDFGLARLSDSPAPAVTVSGQIFGTPPYMSPEQILGQTARTDRRTDVWALGVTLYECTTGKRPFGGETVATLAHAITHEEPEWPRRLNPLLSRDLAVVCQTALTKELDRRYQTAEALAEDLRRVREREPILARPVSRCTKVIRWAQRNPGVAISSAVAVLILVAGTVVSLLLKAQSDANTSRAEVNAQDAQVKLRDWDRLADGRRVDDLIKDAEQLWPAEPSKVTAMEGWLFKARKLTARLPEFEAALEDLRSTARPYSEEAQLAHRASNEDAMAPELEVLRARTETLGKQREEKTKRLESATADLKPLTTKTELSEREERQKELLEDQADSSKERITAIDAELADLRAQASSLRAHLDDRLSWDFGDDPRAQLQHDKLVDLVNKLRILAGEPKASVVTIAGMESRRNVARTLAERTVEAHKKAWAAATARIAAPGSKHGGLALRPQVGLIPLGPDLDSGLDEFAETETGEPPARDPASKKLVVTEATGIVFVLLPAGKFWMGAQSKDPAGLNYDPDAPEDEGPPQEVTLAPFFLSKYEMTQGQWLRFVGSNPSNWRREEWPEISLRSPVEEVSWDDCQLVLGHLGYRLPTEAQWEYACRAGTRTVFSTGNDPGSLLGSANIADESGAARFQAGWNREAGFRDGYPFTSPVGVLKPNGLGLHDMHGNVWEWCKDGYDNYGSHAPRQGDGLRSLPGARKRVYRGGSFAGIALTARSAYHGIDDHSLRGINIGLRPARRLEP